MSSRSISPGARWPTDLPLLAICRGAQVLNVAVGGTLIQDIPSSVESVLKHAIRRRGTPLAHEVEHYARIAACTRLWDRSVAASGSCRVNSRHHQSVRTTRTGLVATATASDGVVEAIEQPEARFCLGIQWHPENFWRTGEFEGAVRIVRGGRARADDGVRILTSVSH